MGCGGSKEGDGKENKAIDSEFKEIGMAEFDDFFRDAHDLLENAEKIRSGIEDTREKGSELAHTWQLKEPKYIDTVQVLFWAASAENGGQIKKTDLSVTSEAPFVKMDGTKVTHDTYTLYESFSTYLKTVIEGPTTLNEIIDKLTVMSQKAPDMLKNGKSTIQNSSLDFKGKAQGIARLGSNCTKLPKELAKCQALKDVLQQANTDLKELIPKLKDLAATADEVGAKAAAENVTRPGDIFDKYHPGPKKTAKEVEEEKKGEGKGKEKEKGKDKEKKKDKEGKDKEKDKDKEKKNKDKGEEKDKEKKKDKDKEKNKDKDDEKHKEKDKDKEKHKDKDKHKDEEAKE